MQRRQPAANGCAGECAVRLIAGQTLPRSFANCVKSVEDYASLAYTFSVKSPRLRCERRRGPPSWLHLEGHVHGHQERQQGNGVGPVWHRLHPMFARLDPTITMCDPMMAAAGQRILSRCGYSDASPETTQYLPVLAERGCKACASRLFDPLPGWFRASPVLAWSCGSDLRSLGLGSWSALG